MSLTRLAGSGVLAATLLLSGCAGQLDDGGDGPAGRYQDPLGLPLEGRSVDFFLYGAAVDSFMAECMAQAGHEYTVATWDLSLPAVPAYTSLGYPNLDAELVRNYGYRAPRDPREIIPPAPLDSAIGVGEEEAYLRAQQECTDESRGAVPDIAESANILRRLDSKSREGVLSDGEVASSVDRWRACVTRADPPLGDPSGGPDDFRVSVLTAVDARDHPGQVDTMTAKAPADEIETAMIDVECRNESGYDTAYFSAVGEEQERLVSEYSDALQEVEQSMRGIQQAINFYVIEGQGR
ncbi:hypothetical protein [Cellulomonas timonensis]|uniref:hypothetical protein n=1 Tax=Cellulomonas timonensis TaxID=1689271 RepID=UPI00083709AF|nr:hypothetical protein [Cellulomonas timonensis]